MCFNFLGLKMEMPIDNSILSLYFLSLPSVFFSAFYFPIVTNYKAPVCKIQVRTENLEFIEFETSLVHIVSSRTATTIQRDRVSTPMPPTHTLQRRGEIYIFQQENQMHSVFTTEYLPQNTFNERTLKNNSSSRINFTNNSQVIFQINSFKLTGTHFSKKEKGRVF